MNAKNMFCTGCLLAAIAAAIPTMAQDQAASIPTPDGPAILARNRGQARKKESGHP